MKACQQFYTSVDYRSGSELGGCLVVHHAENTDHAKPSGLNAQPYKTSNLNPDSIDSLSLLQHLPSAVLALDNFGKVQFANLRAIQLFSEDVVDELWRNTIDRCFVSTPVTENLETKCGRALNLEIAPLENKQGQVLLFHDVTQIIGFSKIRDHIAKLTEMGEMAARLAHQVRTPLSASMLYLSNLQGDGEEKSISTNKIDKCMTGLKHIEAIVNDMLLYSAPAKKESEKIDLAELIQHLKQESAVLENEYGCHIDFSTNCNIETFTGNPVTLKAAISNIIVNAAQSCALKIKQTKKINNNTYVGRVAVNVAAIADGHQAYSIEIRIEDNGVGINSTIIEKINHPFFTTKSNGTGLGLAVAKSVIDDIQGAIVFESVLGEGAAVKVLLP